MEALTRFRWRRRGAWQWPTFAAALLCDAALLKLLPIAGSGPSVAGAVVLAGFFNLLAVAVAGPLLAVWWRARRPQLPRVVARDYAATASLIGLALILLGLGVAHRPAVLGTRRAFAAQSGAVRRYVQLEARPYLRGIDRADTWRIDADLFRTCVPGPDPARRLCLYVDTATSPPGVTLDPNQAPNSTYIGPRAVGRAPG
ncbi:MAG: hypothetical protein ACR2ND_02060 [Solirubrobacteraceae bacterium]